VISHKSGEGKRNKKRWDEEVGAERKRSPFLWRSSKTGNTKRSPVWDLKISLEGRARQF